jgi:hypothetical protein
MKTLVIRLYAVSAAIALAHADERPKSRVIKETLGLMKQAIPYDPAAATQSKAASETAPDVIVLPKMTVRDHWKPALDPEKFLSPAALAALLAKKYPGTLRAGRPTDYTTQSHFDDKRLEHLNELSSFAGMLHGVGNESEGKQLKKLIQSTFIRQHDWISDAADKDVNGNRR